jgi:predicted amidohydrolase
MKINNKKILIFPEYHLTDFPPQIKMSQVEAYDALMIYEKFGFDVFIAGYVEVDAGSLYSSCLVIEGRNVFNIRKRYPYEDEKKIITAWNGANSPIELSIGLSYFLLCHDFTLELTEQKNITVNQNIENLFLISAMFYRFSENLKAGIDYCKKCKIKRFITADRFNGIIQTVVNNAA